MSEYTVLTYTENGRDIFKEWFDSLRDVKAKTAIYRTLLKLENGNLGDNHYCRDGVWEIRINISAGYRIYYSMVGKVILLLLCAGTKRTQNKDIDKAVNYLNEFNRRNKK